MTSYVPPVKNAATGWIGYVALSPKSPTGAFQSNPTLAAGDVKISLNGGALANLNTLPAVTPASSKLVKITLSQAETNADNLTIIFSDAAGDEWADLVLNLQTVARQIDDLAFPNTSGRGIDVTAGGEVGIDWANVGSPTTTVNLSGTTIKTATDVEADTADIQSRLPAALGANGNIKADIRDYNGVAGTFASGRPEVNASHVAGAAAVAQIRDAIVDDATRIDASALNTLSSHDPGETIMGATDLGTGAGLTTLATAAAVADLPTNAELATALGGADDAVLTAVANMHIDLTLVKTQTDKLTFTIPNQVDVNLQYVNDVQLAGNGTSIPMGAA